MSKKRPKISIKCRFFGFDAFTLVSHELDSTPPRYENEANLKRFETTFIGKLLRNFQILASTQKLGNDQNNSVITKDLRIVQTLGDF